MTLRDHFSVVYLSIHPSVSPSVGLFVCLSVCLSVRPSVRLSVRTSYFSRQTFYFANNSSSTDAIEMKLHMWIELKRVKSHARDP